MDIYEYAERYGEHVSDLRRDELEQHDTRCHNCGLEFDCGWIAATRLQPGEATIDECPSCGSDRLEAL